MKWISDPTLGNSDGNFQKRADNSIKNYSEVCRMFAANSKRFEHDPLHSTKKRGDVIAHYEKIGATVIDYWRSLLVNCRLLKRFVHRRVRVRVICQIHLQNHIIPAEFRFFLLFASFDSSKVGLFFVRNLRITRRVNRWRGLWSDVCNVPYGKRLE